MSAATVPSSASTSPSPINEHRRLYFDITRGARRRPSNAPPPKHSARECAELAALFKVLGSTTRLRLLHLLVTHGETCVGDIARGVSMTPQAVSNQLQRLASLGIVSARRVGAEVHYQVINPCVPSLLEKGLCLIRKQC